jgi:hypothetical protein
MRDHSQTTFWIYLLAESDTGEVRYVGSTLSREIRLAAHLAPWEGGYVMREWKRDLRKRRARPVMITIREVVGREAAHLAESEEIDARVHLSDLLNQRRPRAAKRSRARHAVTMIAERMNRNHCAARNDSRIRPEHPLTQGA